MEKFLKKYHSEILEEYQMYLRKDNPPKVGSMIKTLKAGFGGSGGQELKVIEVTEKWVRLSNGVDTYVSDIYDWWKELKILSEPK